MSAISHVSHLREQQIYLSLLNSPTRGPSTTWLSRNSSSRASEFPLLHWTPGRMDLTEGIQGTTAERLGKASEALQNALCQSIPPNPGEDAIIRVFPAWPNDWNAQFKLLCRGNFLISSSFQNGQIEFVEIKSQAGQDYTIRNPWGDSAIEVYAGTKKLKTVKGDLIFFQTKTDGQYILKRK
jgi:hypothetical protein